MIEEFKTGKKIKIKTADGQIVEGELDTLREKIAKIIENVENELDEGVSIYQISDRILSLIIESLPEEVDKETIHPAWREGYNACREETIKMLKAL